MNKIYMLFLSALALPLMFGIAHAVVDPDELPQVSCSEMKFGAAFLAKFPQAPQACQDARIYKGKRYAKFEAKVYISDPAFMTVQMLNAAGDTVTTFSFKPSPTQKVLTNGKEKLFHDLAVGEKITFWVSEKRLEAIEMPGSENDHWSVLPPLSN
ncbi:MAG TPA: hypothetical protein VGI32_01225 [Steroidobacteraceae bacterium]|jgi:hypothetical protein